MATFLGLVYLLIGIVIGIHAYMYIYLPKRDALDGHLLLIVIVLTSINLAIAGLELMAGSLYLPGEIDWFLTLSTLITAVRLGVSGYAISRLFFKNIRGVKYGRSTRM